MATFHQNLVQSFLNFKNKYMRSYDTWADAQSDIANIPEGSVVYTNESISRKENGSLVKKADKTIGNLTAEDDLQFQFSKSGTAYGYKDVNGNFVPFKNPTGTKSITANGSYDVTDYASVLVNVSGGIGFTNYGTIRSTTSIPCKQGDYIVIMNHWAGVSVSNASEVWSATQNNTTCKIFKANSTSVVISESVAYNLYVCKIYAL